MVSRRSSGQSTIGGSEAVAGRPRRTAAVWARSRRCTTALVKCVVPIITTSTAEGGSLDASSTLRSAATTPDMTSDEVAAFTPAMTFVPSMTTASVLVPPTSMPILITPVFPLLSIWRLVLGEAGEHLGGGRDFTIDERQFRPHRLFLGRNHRH